MKHILIAVACTLLAVQATAQRGGRGQNFQRIEAAKVGFITQRLNLTPEQAERFWPVYRRYQDEMRGLRKKAVANGRAQRGTNTMSEAESRRAIEEKLDLQEDRLALKRKYKDQFLRVISAQQLVALYDSEQEFNKLLVQRLRQKRQKRMSR